MYFNKRKYNLIQHVITVWENEKKLSTEQANDLRYSVTLQKFDWKRLAKYCFIFSAICLIIALSAVLFDDFILHLVKKILDI